MIQFITRKEPSWSHPDIQVSDSLDKVIGMFKNTDIIGGDTENNLLNTLYATPLLSQFSDGVDSYVIDKTTVECGFLKDYTDKTYLTANGQYDYMIWKYHYGVRFPNLIDIMINEQVVGRGALRSNSLEAIHERRLNAYLPLPKSTRGSFKKMKYNPDYEVDHILYSAYDPKCLFPIFEAQKPLINEYKLNKRIFEIANPLIPILGDMCLEGFYINEELWIQTLYSNKHEKYKIECLLDEEIRKFAKDHIEIRSGKWVRKRYKTDGQQVGLFGDSISVSNENTANVSYSSFSDLCHFFNILREPIPQKKNIKTQELQDSFAEEALEQYKIEYPSTRMKPFIELLLQYREIEKEINSFGEIFIKDRVRDGKSKKKFKRGYKNSITGKVHTIYKQEFTKNGRLASGDGRKKGADSIGFFNSQQIPKKNKYRNAFTLTPQEIADGWFITTRDLEQAELRIFASQSGDKKLIELVNAGDIHSTLATAAYSKIIRYIIDNMPESRAYDEIYQLLKVNRLQDMLKKKIVKDGVEIIIDLTKQEEDEITKQRVTVALSTRGFVVDKKNSPDIREPQKNATYGIAYGASEGKIAETLNIAPFYAKLTLDAFRDEIPVAFAYLDRVARFGVKYGYIVFNEITNSRHWFQSWLDARTQGRELTNKEKGAIERFCKNAVMSGTQADMIKEGMVKIEKHIRQSFVAETIRGKLIEKVEDKFRWKLQVHDELVFMHRHNNIEEAKEYADKLSTILTDICNTYMKGDMKMKIAGDTNFYWNK